MLFRLGCDTPYEMLYDQGDVKVVFCYECQLFHIHYRAIALDLKLKALREMVDALRLNMSFYRGVTNPEKRCIEVCTPSSILRLRLSMLDMQELLSILQGSEMILKQRIWQHRYN